MGTKHTPGPWSVYEQARYPGLEARNAIIVTYVDEGAEEVGVRGTEPDEDREEVLANARLIAAAPELLEVVRELIEAGHEDAALMRRAELSIAKATGDE